MVSIDKCCCTNGQFDYGGCIGALSLHPPARHRMRSSPYNASSECQLSFTLSPSYPCLASLGVRSAHDLIMRGSTFRFTFLATLFLLLAISSAIIMRGIFLRRRFRRRLEEAIAAGVLLSPTEEAAGGFGRGMGGRRKLKRPTLFDVTVLPPYFYTGSPQAGKWERVMVRVYFFVHRTLCTPCLPLLLVACHSKRSVRKARAGPVTSPRTDTAK